jgi:hypothetical protein
MEQASSDRLILFAQLVAADKESRQLNATLAWVRLLQEVRADCSALAERIPTLERDTLILLQPPSCPTQRLVHRETLRKSSR